VFRVYNLEFRLDFKNHLKRILYGLPKRIKIDNRYVGEGEPVFTIAEIGINHNGDLELAKRLITEAAKAGADAVKFQKRTAEELLTKEGLEKPYTSPHAFAPTYGEHRKKLEFSPEQYQVLMAHARECGVRFFASVWDHVSADQMHALGVGAYKIPSADMTNLPLIEYVAQKDRPVILSTGMSTVEEIDDAVYAALKHNSRVMVMHCLSLYPSPLDKINLAFMDIIRERYSPLPFGYSGHEAGLLPTIVAVARGAQIIERHFTLDKTMKGSDHAGSLEPHELKELVAAVHHIPSILGTSEKVIIPELIPLREKLAKSVIAKQAIPAGTIITADMLGIKGPGYGITPSKLGEVVGRVAAVNVGEDTVLPKEALDWPKRGW
jgi:sialic acid synthase